MFNSSLSHLIRYRPWRWIDEVAGTKQELQGVFILLSDELIDWLAANLTQAQKDELRGWAHRISAAECAEWHVPVWAGNTGAVFIRVPSATWNNPDGAPPAKVKQYFQSLWREPV